MANVASDRIRHPLYSVSPRRSTATGGDVSTAAPSAVYRRCYSLAPHIRKAMWRAKMQIIRTCYIQSHQSRPRTWIVPCGFSVDLRSKMAPVKNLGYHTYLTPEANKQEKTEVEQGHIKICFRVQASGGPSSYSTECTFFRRYESLEHPACLNGVPRDRDRATEKLCRGRTTTHFDVLFFKTRFEGMLSTSMYREEN